MEELFETCDEAGRFTGLAERSRVHAEGLWHRAVHVWLFDPCGRVWIQRRGWHKDINAGIWDVSVGEHLQPGESWSEAAARGLREELAIEKAPTLEPLGDVRRVVLDRPEAGIHDHELQQAFRACHDGPVRPDPDEVTEVRLIDPASLKAWLVAEPYAFTHGCRSDVAELDLFDGIA